MQNLLTVNREMREINDPKERAREYTIRKIQATYGYNHENAEKVYELMKVRQVEFLWGAGCGAFAYYKLTPFQRELERKNALFRKAWMRYPLQTTAFVGAAYVGSMIPTRLLRRFQKNDPGVTRDTYTGRADIVGHFRLFENDNRTSEEDKLRNYLASYSKEAMTKPELCAQLLKNSAKDVDFGKLFRVKRMGKDLDDIFWAFGKVHGLENIAFATPEEIEACNGNPVALQELVNKIDGRNKFYSTSEELQADIKASVVNYNKAVDALNLHPSDSKKLKALPYYLAKRSEMPEPRRGQYECELFKELTGMDWFADAHTDVDREEKITEFNYEKFLHPSFLATRDTSSESFKREVRELNLTRMTQHERLQKAKQAFRQLMPILKDLTKFEQKSFIHLVKNRMKGVDFQELDEALLENMMSNDTEEELARLSEESNYALKNRYRHQRQTMDYADPKRMPVDETKVRDLLRNQHLFRAKMDEEVGTYSALQLNPQMQNGVLTYLTEAAYGDMKDLINDVGISGDSVEFFNLAAIRKLKDNKIHASDDNFHYLMNAMFQPVDMTDYEDSFVGFNELSGAVPINRLSWLKPLMTESFPQTDKLATLEQLEKKPVRGTSSSFQSIMESVRADPPEEDEEEEDDDEEEGEGEEGGEEGAEEGGDDYGDYGEEEAGEQWPPEARVPGLKKADRVFYGNNSLKGNYSEVEIDAFMKLLAVKPYRQWQDESTHHYKLGVHTYEDSSQEVDPDFHLLSEVERKEAERTQTAEWRRGTEVKFDLGKKSPGHLNFRF